MSRLRTLWSSVAPEPSVPTPCMLTLCQPGCGCISFRVFLVLTSLESPQMETSPPTVLLAGRILHVWTKTKSFGSFLSFELYFWPQILIMTSVSSFMNLILNISYLTLVPLAVWSLTPVWVLCESEFWCRLGKAHYKSCGFVAVMTSFCFWNNKVTIFRSWISKIFKCIV